MKASPCPALSADLQFRTVETVVLDRSASGKAEAGFLRFAGDADASGAHDCSRHIAGVVSFDCDISRAGDAQFKIICLDSIDFDVSGTGDDQSHIAGFSLVKVDVSGTCHGDLKAVNLQTCERDLSGTGNSDFEFSRLDAICLERTAAGQRYGIEFR